MKWYILLFMGFLFANCAAQKIDLSNEIILDTPLSVEKIMVLCLSPSDKFRSSFESAMKQELQFHGVHTETSKQHLPFNLLKDFSTAKKLEALIESLPSKGFNKLLISTTSEVEHTLNDADGNFGDFELFHLVTNLYTIDENGSSLVWSMCLIIYDYQIPFLSVQDFANAIIGKMREDGVLNLDDAHELKLFTI